MTKQMQKKIIILALFAGEIMMKNGAEIYRVEDTITRICKACKIPYVEVFVTPTGMFLSVDNGDDSDLVTYLKRISFGNLKLPNDLEIGSVRELTASEVELLVNSKKGEE